MLLFCSVLTEWNLPEAESGDNYFSELEEFGSHSGNPGNQLQRIGVGGRLPALSQPPRGGHLDNRMSAPPAQASVEARDQYKPSPRPPAREGWPSGWGFNEI